MNIQIENRLKAFDASAWRQLLRRSIETTLEHERFSCHIAEEEYALAIDVTLVSERQIRQLNDEHRGEAEATDILSFPMLRFDRGVLDTLQQPIALHDMRPRLNGELELFLGDLIICPDVVLRQAESCGRDTECDVVYLAAHGVLHLLGYDHMTDDDDTIMKKKQEAVCLALGFDNTAAEKSEIVRCGFVALVGRPNVGKSTLLNAILDTRVAITSPKPQTTRTVIRGVHDDESSQIIFLDTPGMHQPKHRLGDAMVKSARHAMLDADVVLLMIDARFRPYVDELEARLTQEALQAGKSILLVINKTDLVAKESILPLIAAFSEAFPYEAIIPISARRSDQIDVLLEEIRCRLPLSPRLFSSDDYTNQTEQMLASELIRAAVLFLTEQEIPHGTAVAIERFESFNDPSGARRRVQIDAAILCDRKSHKGILIGKQGQMIKAIGTRARRDIEHMLDCPCDLRLFVKVRKDWRNRSVWLADLGFDSSQI